MHTVYLIEKESEIQKIILPVHGKGLWSTMYGFLALQPDLRTVTGFSFYEHGETPGLGGEVDNPTWKAMWPGKQVFDENGDIAVEVAKGRVNPNDADAIYQVDGLAGASITARGVTNLLHFWLGNAGFGPYLEKLKSEGGSNG